MACLVVKFLCTCSNLASLSEPTSVFLHWVYAWVWLTQTSAQGLGKARAILHTLFTFHEKQYPGQTILLLHARKDQSGFLKPTNRNIELSAVSLQPSVEGYRLTTESSFYFLNVLASERFYVLNMSHPDYASIFKPLKLNMCI